jgi:hypothetical protein
MKHLCILYTKEGENQRIMNQSGKGKPFILHTS